MGKNVKVAALFFVCVVLMGAPIFWYMTRSVQMGPQDASFARVKARGTLIVGMDPPYEPLETFTESGEIVGLEVDIVQHIADQMGVKLELRDIDWSDLFEKVKTNEIDLAIAAFTITPERQKEYLFSIPYLDGGQTIIIRKGDTSIRTPSDLQGKKVAAQEESTSLTEATKYTSADRVISFASFEDGILNDLKNKKVDAMIIDYIGGWGLVKNDSMLVFAGEPFTQEYYGILSNKENKSIIGEVNRIVKQMVQTGTLKNIINRWMSLSK